MYLELFSRDNFLLRHFSKVLSKEKYSGSSPPASPMGSYIQGAAFTSVHRCTFEQFIKQKANKPSPRCQS